MVCQLRPLVYNWGLNNPPRICLTPRKSRVKNVWRIKQGDCHCKMVGAGIRSFVKFRGQMPRIATTGITFWQTAPKLTADCQAPHSGCQEYTRSGQACGNPLSNLDSWLCQSCDIYFIRGNLQSKHLGLQQSAAHIWAQNLARDWIPATAILHRESTCLKRDIFLPHGF
jgi:hypothetical protein